MPTRLHKCDTQTEKIANVTLLWGIAESVDASARTTLIQYEMSLLRDWGIVRNDSNRQTPTTQAPQLTEITKLIGDTSELLLAG